MALLVGGNGLMTPASYKSCLLSLTEGAQPALGVQTAVRSETPGGSGGLVAAAPPPYWQCFLLACFQVHDFDFNFPFILIILLNLYSGDLNAFQK